ncbi:IS1 family transposase [Hydrogenothermus marinus]|uniref:IS1 family transposase n=1 Tax=Hydrogenothermus marinus TaxID=133270 RepID=UPI000EF9F9A7|nr:IS1 family transposase [Hydrogenothermus marinus]
MWIWIVVFDKDYKYFEIGKRDEETFWKLLNQIPTAKEYHTDGYKVYENLRNRKKGKYNCTNWNEGLNSFLRSKLAMLQRKTKAYAKSIRALYRALALVFIRWNLLYTL